MVMRVSNAVVLDLLKSSGKLKDEQIKNLQAQETDKKTLQDVAISSGLVSEK
jgi:hypothetical protein